MRVQGRTEFRRLPCKWLADLCGGRYRVESLLKAANNGPVSRPCLVGRAMLPMDKRKGIPGSHGFDSGLRPVPAVGHMSCPHRAKVALPRVRRHVRRTGPPGLRRVGSNLRGRMRRKGAQSCPVRTTQRTGPPDQAADQTEQNLGSGADSRRARRRVQAFRLLTWEHVAVARRIQAVIERGNARRRVAGAGLPDAANAQPCRTRNRCPSGPRRRPPRLGCLLRPESARADGRCSGSRWVEGPA